MVIALQSRPSFSQGYATPQVGGLAYPSLWRGVVGAWAPSLGATGLTLRDHSGYARHGAVTNQTAAESWVDPHGLTFDAVDGYISTMPTDDLTTNDYTITCWAYSNTTAGTTRVFSDWHTQRSIMVRISSGNIQYYVGGGTSTLAGNISTSYAAYVDKWTMVTATHQASTNTITIFLDGKQAGQTTYTGTAGTTGATLEMSDASQAFDGVQDDLIAYSRLLTPNEVATLHRLGPGGIYRRQQFNPVVSTEAAAGGLGIPFAAYHQFHNVGSNL